MDLNQEEHTAKKIHKFVQGLNEQQEDIGYVLIMAEDDGPKISSNIPVNLIRNFLLKVISCLISLESDNRGPINN